MARGISQRLNPLVVFFKFRTVRVDQYRSWIGLNNVRSRVENFDAAFDESWSRYVVCGLPAKQFGARQLDASNEIPAGADVLLVAHVSDSAIAVAEFADNVRRRIRGRVVGDKDLDIRIRLVDERFERERQIALRIIRGDADRNSRGAGRRHSNAGDDTVALL